MVFRPRAVEAVSERQLKRCFEPKDGDLWQVRAEIRKLVEFEQPIEDDVKPPAERYLDEQDTAALAAQGIMAFQSFRNRNAVRLSAFHTVS